MAEGGLPVDTSAPAPTRFEVLLDEGTGVCVGVTDLDGADAGDRFEVAIEEVDEPYDAALFEAPRRRGRRGRRPARRAAE